MIYSQVKTPVWANSEHTLIDCFVTFDALGEVPFTAAQNDTEYSNEIFELCLSGKFGLIAEYVAPVVVANLDQPETSGTQSL